MATTIDPATGRPLAPDAIQRVLHITPSVHVYNIPPTLTTKGYTAATWTADPTRHIFSARLRILETATLSGTSETVKTDVLLEDPKTGDLFAAAPYTDPSVVEQVLDSSRFFAVRVVGDGGRKAVLGIGFEQRPEAFDFNISLQEVGKVLGFGNAQDQRKGPKGKAEEPAIKKSTDYSLKEGQMINVTIGGKGRRPQGEEKKEESTFGGSTAIPFLPPPPSAEDIKAAQRNRDKSPAADSGFDDGEFGEFQ